MTTDDLLNVDYRENKVIIQKALLKIKPLSKYSEEEQIPLSAIEKLIHLMCKKYKVWIRGISFDPTSNDDYDVLRCEIINENDLSLIRYIYGICIYEIMAKSAILVWSEIKNKNLNRR